jgi:hypothetical protein
MVPDGGSGDGDRAARARALASSVVSALPAMAQPPLGTSSKMQTVTRRMFSPSISTIASVRCSTISYRCDAVKTPSRALTSMSGMVSSLDGLMCHQCSARELLLEGLAMAAGCGATALDRRARAELATIGLRPRTSLRSGAASLTPASAA